MKRCPECDYPNPDERETCFKCGVDLNAKEEPPAEPEPAGEPVAAPPAAEPVPQVQGHVRSGFEIPPERGVQGRKPIPAQVYVATAILGGGGLLQLLFALSFWGFGHDPLTIQSIAAAQGVCVGCAFIGVATILVLVDLVRGARWAWIGSIVLSFYYMLIALVPLAILAGQERYELFTNVFFGAMCLLVLGAVALWCLLCPQSRSAVWGRRK
jgi:hypothetical protein